MCENFKDLYPARVINGSNHYSTERGPGDIVQQTFNSIARDILLQSLKKYYV